MQQTGLTELEFARLMRGLPMETETHRAVLKAVLVGNPHVDADTFGLAWGAVARVPKDKIHTVTQRQLLNEYGFPAIFVCVDPMPGDKQGLP